MGTHPRVGQAHTTAQLSVECDSSRHRGWRSQLNDQFGSEGVGESFQYWQSRNGPSSLEPRYRRLRHRGGPSQPGLRPAALFPELSAPGGRARKRAWLRRRPPERPVQPSARSRSSCQSLRGAISRPPRPRYVSRPHTVGAPDGLDQSHAPRASGFSGTSSTARSVDLARSSMQAAPHVLRRQAVPERLNSAQTPSPNPRRQDKPRPCPQCRNNHSGSWHPIDTAGGSSVTVAIILARG